VNGDRLWNAGRLPVSRGDEELPWRDWVRLAVYLVLFVALMVALATVFHAWPTHDHTVAGY